MLTESLLLQNSWRLGRGSQLEPAQQNDKIWQGMNMPQDLCVRLLTQQGSLLLQSCLCWLLWCLPATHLPVSAGAG